MKRETPMEATSTPGICEENTCGSVSGEPGAGTPGPTWNSHKNLNKRAPYRGKGLCQERLGRWPAVSQGTEQHYKLQL